MRTRTLLGRGRRGTGLIEKAHEDYLLIAHFDSHGFFSGFVNSLSIYSELQECKVNSLVGMNNNPVGVDLYQNGESHFLKDVKMSEAMHSAKSEKPDTVLYRVGKVEGLSFKQAFYIHFI